MIPTSHRHNRCGTRKLKLRASIKTRGSSYIPRRWHGLILSHNGNTNNHSFNPNSYFDLKHVWWQSISQLLKFPKGTSRSNVAHTSCKFEPESNEVDSAPTKESESSTRVDTTRHCCNASSKTRELPKTWKVCDMPVACVEMSSFWIPNAVSRTQAADLSLNQRKSKWISPI